MRILRKSRVVVEIYIVIPSDIALSGSLNRFYGEKWVNAIIECVIRRPNRDHLHHPGINHRSLFEI